MTEATPDGAGETGMPGSWPVLVILVFPFACMIALSFVGLDWLQQTLPSLPVKAANFPVLGTWAFTLAILFRARPAGWADLRRICLFVFVVEVAAVLLVLAGAGLLRQSSLDPRSGEFMMIEFVATVGVIFLLCEFLMRLGLLPGCSSLCELRRISREEQRPFSEHYRPRHWVAGLVVGLAATGMTWLLLAWLGDVALIYVLDPLAVPPLAMGAGLFAGLAMAFSRPPDGGTWGRSLLAALLAALLFPAFHVGLDQAIYVWAPPADPEEARWFAGVLISILAAFIPPLAMVGVAALRLGGLPAGSDAKPDGEATPAATRPNRWKRLTFDHAAAAAILFVGVWAGVYGLLEYIWSVRPVPAFPSIAALVMGVAAGALPLVARPSGSRGWAAASAALLAILAAMPAALATLVYAIRAWFSPLPDIHTILAVTHFGPLLPAAAILATTAWIQGRHRTEGEGEP